MNDAIYIQIPKV